MIYSNFQCNAIFTIFSQSVPNLESISSSLQHLWALAEEVGAKQTEKQLGRYEVRW